MKTIKCLLLMAALLLLTACSNAGDIEKMLRAPRSGGESGIIQKALNDYLGEEVQLKFPTSGDFLSPFLYGDWNGDGQEDAAVLFTSDKTGQNVCVAVLEKEGDSWKVTSVADGLATEVESVTYATMQDSQAAQLLVGYGSEQAGRYLAVYAYQDGHLQTVLEQTYSRLLLADITGSGSDDLILVLPENEVGSVEVQMLTNLDGSFHLSQEIPVGAGKYTGCAGLHAGYGRDGMPYLVVDGMTGGSGSYLASTILIYDGETGQLLTYQAPDISDMYEATLRYHTALVSTDLDGSGSVDIPREITDGGLIQEEMEKRLAYLMWYDYTGHSGGNRIFGVWDMDNNFFIPLPESMQGQVLLESYGDGWCVRSTDGEETYLFVRLESPSTSSSDFTRLTNIGSQQLQIKLESPYPGLDIQTILKAAKVL